MLTLSPIEAWYARRRWTVFDFQRACSAAYARGESGLIHAPTGDGKTLAAWLGPLLEAKDADEPKPWTGRLVEEAESHDQTPPPSSPQTEGGATARG